MSSPIRSSRREPDSRRARPAKAPLSRTAIVDAALIVIERDGERQLSMRRLADELDTGAASLYVYVRNTTHLKALILDRLLTELDVAWNGDELACDRLCRLLTEYTDLLIDHPAIIQSALHIWPDGPRYLDIVELLLRLLMAAGVSSTEHAAWAVDLLLQHATACAVEWSHRSTTGEQSIGDLVTILNEADPRRHPTLHSLGPSVFTAGNPDEHRHWNIRMIVSAVLRQAISTQPI
ncbi:TetR/AcrR family transcriptional regulator [Mycobacterium sp. 236(2023)]|uniref:TetR/AcrR family transcriptional regulator n=1 Tax=Mycobacterium sp. 236(2023) TaxID=3038163 RepID=UPI002414E61D|nr:TetR/AcrR family transcriptional regulator [Mycobacterium sp. 236(2023)]MDG4668038.1 TetR/AcrR family transcriptional regulator [Mycobacterium sp. 236(2023)]